MAADIKMVGTWANSPMGKRQKASLLLAFIRGSLFVFLLSTLVPSIRGLLVLSQHFLLKILGYAH